MNEVVLGYIGSLWIGLNRGTQAQWGWSRGDEPLSNYSNWDAGRPNGSGQCVVNINNVWRDYNCTVPLYFVCYYEGKGYILVQSNKTWQDAQSYCRSYYTDLATIRSPWEQKHLIELVGRGVFVWIGLFLDTWEWSDQWSLFFRNWALGQPSSTSGNCTAMMTNDSGKWTVQNCNAALPFICYGEENMVKRKNIIKIKVAYSGTANLNDLSLQAVILKEIEKKIIGQSKANDIKLSWKLRSDGNVFVKQGARDKNG
ncbi:macrophage mannose receptor 1-like [Pangasianodon hypophthalmus]|uniref:macrophage mannose receptor 1-like n=1 Tax=Pangasianodon hypophthalmus TaxID=310915 RepID=UPI00147AE83B|nr:macrophage mannose receptor 1-like [Pangasianodon hypophthalmus]